MQVEKIDIKYDADLFLLVGKSKEDSICLDAILLDCAFSYSSSPNVAVLGLDAITINNKIQKIIICGHGNKKKRTIGNSTMGELAEF